MPAGAEEGILKGMYPFSQAAADGKTPRVQLLGSGTILREVIAAAQLLEQDWGVAADVWSCPSFNELRRDGLDADRWNMLHPLEKPRLSYVEEQLKDRAGPVVAATDYMKIYADQIRPFVQNLGKRYRVLGTDGFGRSDSRENLRRFFEVNRHYVTVAALRSLAEDGAIKPQIVADAIKKYGIDPEQAESGHGVRGTSMSALEVLVPDIGDFKDIPVIEVLVKAGDTVAKDDPLIAGVGQGDDGSPVARGRGGQGHQGQGGRQGQRRQPGAYAGSH